MSDTALTASAGMTVARLMAYRVFRPGRGGVADADGVLPLQALLLQAVRRAEFLRKTGIERGIRVALVVKNRSWASIAIDYLACAWIGAVAVLAADDQLRKIVDGPVRLIDDYVEDNDLCHAFPGRDRPRPDDPLDIVFSSGTTGTPKPTIFYNRDWSYRLSESVNEARTGVVHCGIPFETSTGVHGILLQHIASGALSVAAKTPEEVPCLAEKLGCRELVVTPYTLRKLTESGSMADALLQFKIVKVVAGPLSEHLASAAIDAFPNARIISIYGATELRSAIFTRIVKRGNSNTLGIPSPGTRARIVDDRGAVAPVGAVGEIQISQVALTAERQVALTPERTDHEVSLKSMSDWVGTGDLGYIDEVGGVHLMGRSKELLFLPAGRVAPGDIEDRLLQHPYIRDCGIVTIGSIEGWDKLGACVVLKDHEIVQDVTTMLRSFDPPLFRVRFVSSIPRTALGKPIRAHIWRLLMDSDVDDVWLRP